MSSSESSFVVVEAHRLLLVAIPDHCTEQGKQLVTLLFISSLNVLNRVLFFVDSKGILFDMFKLSFSLHPDLSESW